MEPSNQHNLTQILDSVWAWSHAQGLKGYNKHDGLNSPLLRTLLGWSKWSRIAAIQLVMRMPINIRPMLQIPKTLNPKGLALFTLGLLDRYSLDQSAEYLEQAKQILTSLKNNAAPGNWSGICWGYQYPWQDLGFFAPTNTPNAVVTSFVCEAFLAAYRLTGNSDYLDTVASSCEFFLQDLTVLADEPKRFCLSYMPLHMSMRVMDVSILIGAVLAQYSVLSGNRTLMKTARRLAGYVVQQQTEYGAWFYTDPPAASPIRHDNYHTGFILDALWRYMEASQDWRWRSRYERGLQFYANNLFNPDGAPRWMSDKKYPHDVHGAAQGLLTFSQAARNGYPHRDLAQRIANWSIKNLYHPEGRFYYQVNRHYTKKFTLLRWCNAWMFRGLSAFFLLTNNES